MTQILKKLTAALMSLTLVACGTTGTSYKGPSTVHQSTTLQVDRICEDRDGQKVVIEGVAYNPLGISASTHSALMIHRADQNCNVLFGDDGKPIPYMVAAANSSDFRRDVVTGVIGLGQSYVSGGLAAQANKNACRGGACAGPQINVQANSGAIAEAEVRMCGNAPCGSSPD